MVGCSTRRSRNTTRMAEILQAEKEDVEGNTTVIPEHWHGSYTVRERPCPTPTRTVREFVLTRRHGLPCYTTHLLAVIQMVRPCTARVAALPSLALELVVYIRHRFYKPIPIFSAAQYLWPWTFFNYEAGCEKDVRPSRVVEGANSKL